MCGFLRLSNYGLNFVQMIADFVGKLLDFQSFLCSQDDRGFLRRAAKGNQV
jgi:hypothetical protein